MTLLKLLFEDKKATYLFYIPQVYYHFQTFINTISEFKLGLTDRIITYVWVKPSTSSSGAWNIIGQIVRLQKSVIVS